jgi:hypothetical protein
MRLIKFFSKDNVQGYVHVALFITWFSVLLVGFIDTKYVPTVMSGVALTAILLQIFYEIWVSSRD